MSTSALAQGPPQLTKQQQELVTRSTVVDRAVGVAKGRTSLPETELRGVAWHALCLAASKFEPHREVPFDGFAWKVVLRAMGRAMKHEVKHQRGRVAVEARYDTCDEISEISDPGDVWADDENATREQLQSVLDLAAARMALGVASVLMATSDEAAFVERTHYAAMLDALSQALATLSDYDRQLLELRYFKNLEFDPIAVTLAVSNATVRRHHVAAVTRLGARMRARGFTPRNS